MTKTASSLFILLSVVGSASWRQVDGLTGTSSSTQHAGSRISNNIASFSIQRVGSQPQHLLLLQQRQGQQQLQRRESHRLAATYIRDNGAEYLPSSSSSVQAMTPSSWFQQAQKLVACAALTTALSASLLFSPTAAWAENELSAKYGGGGFDTSLVDQTCLVNHCSLQAKACLADDPSCRKGLTCTAKCLGDNACITGCMARYGNQNLDKLLTCTIEEHECIKVAILDGGADVYGQEPRSPAPTLAHFNYQSLQGTWYKVMGYNPNYDCYACQRNTFVMPSTTNTNTRNNNNNNQQQQQLLMDVEFSMPHLMPDGSPPPPASVRESIQLTPDESLMFGSQSIGLNDYNTHETMIFDTPSSDKNKLVLKKKGSTTTGQPQEVSYARTAHSEGEMFGLKFWENWYILGENDPGTPEFKFIYYNGKTRQNTYEGAFVYSRTRELSPSSMAKVYQIAQDANMNPQQFCKIRNGCFTDDNVNKESDIMDPFRGILASTRVSQLLGVEPVKAEGVTRKAIPTARVLTPESEAMASSSTPQRAWWHEVGDYLENPHRHFQAMDQLRVPMEWPESIVAGASASATTTVNSESATTMSRK